MAIRLQLAVRSIKLFQLIEMTIEAVAFAALTELQLLRKHPLRKVLLCHERRTGERIVPLPESGLICARAARVVRRVYRGLRVRNCLRESLVLHRMLRTRGIDATFRIGVSKTGHTLLGHAWVEHRGQPVVDEAIVATLVPLPLDGRPLARDV